MSTELPFFVPTPETRPAPPDPRGRGLARATIPARLTRNPATSPAP